MTLTRNEDTIIYEADINGSEYDLEIAYTMGDDLDHNDRPYRFVDGWRVYKINGKPNLLGEFWAEQLDQTLICDAIMAQEE
jgi:hypothetical protein